MILQNQLILKYNVKNLNNRVYSKDIGDSIVNDKEIQELIDNGLFYGELKLDNVPEDGRIHPIIETASHRIIKLTSTDDGLYADIEVLEDTTDGKSCTIF